MCRLPPNAAEGIVTCGRSLLEDRSPVATTGSVLLVERVLFGRAVQLSFAGVLSGVNAFEISNLQEQETESRYPGGRDVTNIEKRLSMFTPNSVTWGRKTVEWSFCGPHLARGCHSRMRSSEFQGKAVGPLSHPRAKPAKIEGFYRF